MTCCFTGHRPEKLPWGGDEEDPRFLAFAQRLRQAVWQAYDDGFRHYICGMARGCDLTFAQQVLQLRRDFGDVTLEAAIPCRGQSRYWTEGEQLAYGELLQACDRQTLVQEAYSRGCMLRRNRYMVDASSRLIAAYDGTKGGTLYTIQYAMSRGVAVEIVDVR